MPENAEAPTAAAAISDRSPGARRARRPKMAERETRIIGLLNRGASIVEIAQRERVTVNRMRKVVRAILDKRQPQPPAEYLAAQVGRLNEALSVSYGAMVNPETGANFKAIDSVVRIVRELDRCHGFDPAGRNAEPARRRPSAPVESPRALPARERVANPTARD